MAELREKIARAMHDYGTERGIGEAEALDIADNILAIPEIAEALLLMNTARSRFCEAMRPADPAEYMMSGFQNAHPWANLLKPEDMPPKL